MTQEPGYKSTEFWMTAIGSLVAAVMPLLIANGVLDTEKGEMWATLIMAAAAVVVPIVIGSMVKAYAKARTDVKLEALGLEREAVVLEAMRLEAMSD